MYGASFVQVFVIPSEPVVESNLPVWSSCWNHDYGDFQGSIALCRNNMAEPMPFGTKTQKDYIQIPVKNWQIHSSVCFLIPCKNISDWGNLWVQLSFEVFSCTAFTFAFTATMHGLLDFCLHVCFLCRAFARCVTRGCKIPCRKCTCIC